MRVSEDDTAENGLTHLISFTSLQDTYGNLQAHMKQIGDWISLWLMVSMYAFVALRSIAKLATGAPCRVLVAIISLYTLLMRLSSGKHKGRLLATVNNSSLWSVNVFIALVVTFSAPGTSAKAAMHWWKLYCHIFR